VPMCLSEPTKQVVWCRGGKVGLWNIYMAVSSHIGYCGDCCACTYLKPGEGSGSLITKMRHGPLHGILPLSLSPLSLRSVSHLYSHSVSHLFLCAQSLTSFFALSLSSRGYSSTLNDRRLACRAMKKALVACRRGEAAAPPSAA